MITTACVTQRDATRGHQQHGCSDCAQVQSKPDGRGYGRGPTPRRVRCRVWARGRPGRDTGRRRLQPGDATPRAAVRALRCTRAAAAFHAARPWPCSGQTHMGCTSNQPGSSAGRMVGPEAPGRDAAPWPPHPRAPISRSYLPVFGRVGPCVAPPPGLLPLPPFGGLLGGGVFFGGLDISSPSASACRNRRAWCRHPRCLASNQPDRRCYHHRDGGLPKVSLSARGRPRS